MGRVSACVDVRVWTCVCGHACAGVREKFALVFASLLALSAAASTAQFKRLVQPKNAITCQLCTTIITDLDNFITSDTTEAEIVAFVEQLCSAIGALIPGLEETCNAFVEANLPGIIDG